MNLSEAKKIVDARYHHHLVEIKQNAYMKVDGRVAMVRDEAESKGEKVDTSKPEFLKVGDATVCIVTLKTPRGTATATAEIKFGGTGVDATNPIENAETSALGRALGFLGYGVLDGIASADEVEQAIEHQERLDEPQHETGEPQPASRTDGGKVSEKQLAFLSRLLEERGVNSADCKTLIYSVVVEMDRKGVSESIDRLKREQKLSKEWIQGYAFMLRERTPITYEEMSKYMTEHFHDKTWATLTREDQDQLISWLSIAEGEDDI